MNITTFGAFNTARLGIYAAQQALNVTGHNISNINTIGYTRQRVDQISLRVGGGNHYASVNGGPAGTGVLVTGMSQFRDPYLDIRYRNESSSVGAMDTKLSGLEELSSILDEVGDGAEGAAGEGILEAQFNDLRDQLSKLADGHATEDEYRALVRSSADSLAKLLNDYAKRLETVKENQEDGLETDVKTVNDILKGIQTLNDTILKSEIYGDASLELRDQRNLLIDQLSTYMKIDVTYEAVSIGAGKTVDKVVIKTAGDSPKTLVDGNYAAQIQVKNGVQKNPNDDPADPNDQFVKADGTFTGVETDAAILPYAIHLSELTNQHGSVLKGSKALQFSDTELHGSLQASREMLTESGEFSSKAMAAGDPDATTKRGIPYYQNTLDSLARKFAEVMNGANTGYLQDSSGNILNKDAGSILATKNADGTYQFDADGDGTVSGSEKAYTLDDLKGFGTFKNNSKLMGGSLFSTSSANDNTDKITAANISISKSWSTDASLLQNSFVCAAGSDKPGSADTNNIMHILSQFDARFEYKPNDLGLDAVDGDTKFFAGSFQQMFTNVQATLAQDAKSTTTLLENYASASTSLNVSRDGVSGVDLNDEAMNMMQFQKSYSAACRLMTTLDETLDKLINGTGVVGR